MGGKKGRWLPQKEERVCVCVCSGGKVVDAERRRRHRIRHLYNTHTEEAAYVCVLLSASSYRTDGGSSGTSDS